MHLIKDSKAQQDVYLLIIARLHCLDVFLPSPPPLQGLSDHIGLSSAPRILFVQKWREGG